MQNRYSSKHPRSHRGLLGKRCKASAFFEPLEPRRLLSVDLSGIGNWDSAGPNGINNGQNNANYDNGGLSEPVSGAGEALAPSPVDKNVLYNRGGHSRGSEN